MSTYDGPNWPDTIRAHREAYILSERSDIEEALRMFRGDYWSERDRRDTAMKLVSMNIVYAIAESAVSATVPPNLQFTVYEKEATTSTPWEDYLVACGRSADWRGEATLSMTDAVLTGRSVLKTTLGKSHTEIRAVDPRRVYFDLAARRPSDISYYIELTLLTVQEFESRLRRKGNNAPLYKLPAPFEGTPVKDLATSYPAWISDQAAKTAGTRFIPVYEVYDEARQECTHWLDGATAPLCLHDGKDYFQPFSIYNLNPNAVDCRGLSEVQLVKDCIVAVNRLLSYWGELVRRQVPLTVYDSSRLTEDEVTRLGQAPPGAYVGVNAAGQPPLAVLGTLQSPPVPAEIPNFMAKLEQVISYVSALSDSSRGQVTGARTATELALIEGQQKTRISHRVGRFSKAWEQAAKKAIQLAIMSGVDLPLPVNVEMVAYSPSENNRVVLREKFLGALQFIEAHPDRFNQAEVTRLFAEIMALPPSIIVEPPTEPLPGSPEALAAEQALLGSMNPQQEMPLDA